MTLTGNGPGPPSEPSVDVSDVNGVTFSLGITDNLNSSMPPLESPRDDNEIDLFDPQYPTPAQASNYQQCKKEANQKRRASINSSSDGETKSPDQQRRRMENEAGEEQEQEHAGEGAGKEMQHHGMLHNQDPNLWGASVGGQSPSADSPDSYVMSPSSRNPLLDCNLIEDYIQSPLANSNPKDQTNDQDYSNSQGDLTQENDGTQVTSMTETSIAIHTTDNSRPFLRPRVVSKAIDNWGFKHYVVEQTIRVPGNGSNIILKMKMNEVIKKVIFNKDGFKFGDWQVRARKLDNEEDVINYVRIGPFDRETDLDEIKYDISLNNSSVIDAISWIPSAKSRMRYLRIKIIGPTLEYVRIDRVQYIPKLYTVPYLRCKYCLDIGHSLTTCSKLEPRCNQCSGRHRNTTVGEEMDTGNVERCNKNPYCFQCQGNHGPMSPDCPKNIYAMLLHKELMIKNLPLKDINKKLREITLNDWKTKNNQSPNKTNNWTEHNYAPATIATKNRFVSLNEEDLSNIQAPSPNHPRTSPGPTSLDHQTHFQNAHSPLDIGDKQELAPQTRSTWEKRPKILTRDTKQQASETSTLNPQPPQSKSLQPIQTPSNHSQPANQQPQPPQSPLPQHPIRQPHPQSTIQQFNQPQPLLPQHQPQQSHLQPLNQQPHPYPQPQFPHPQPPPQNPHPQLQPQDFHPHPKPQYPQPQLNPQQPNLPQTQPSHPEQTGNNQHTLWAILWEAISMAMSGMSFIQILKQLFPKIQAFLMNEETM